jgi:hypothetical protein
MVDRLRRLKQIETSAPGGSALCPVTQEATRWLALWMAYDDIIQVAHLKSRANRLDRVSKEVKLQEGELLKVYDHFKPGVPELAAMLPMSWAQAVLKWDRNRVANGKDAWSMPIKLARHSVVGMLSLRFLSLLRVFRPIGHRYITEQALIEEWLNGIASACADVSDGLLGDLGHILKASGVGADIDTRWLRHASDGDTAWPAHCPDLAALPWAQTLACGLTGGDDYELLFTAAPEHRAAVWAAAQASATPVSRVGRVTPAGLRVLDPKGQAIDVSRLPSFDHLA